MGQRLVRTSSAPLINIPLGFRRPRRGAGARCYVATLCLHAVRCAWRVAAILGIALGGAAARNHSLAATAGCGATLADGAACDDVCCGNGDAASLWGGCGDGFCGGLVNPAGGCASGDEILWFNATYQVWKRDGVRLPPLVTASPAGTINNQAILGFPTTTVLAGDREVSDDWRSGFGFEFGYWLDPHSDWALCGDYFNAGRDSYNFLVDTTDGRIIGRPFLNAQTNEQNARLLNLPGQLVGGVGVNAFDDFQGAGFWMQRRLWTRGEACSTAGGAKLNLLGGYRYYHHDSLVYVREDYVAQAGNSFGLPAGQIHLAADKFAGRNEFHGFELGLEGRVQRCRWWAEGLAAVALGGARRVVFVEGTTLNFDPGFAPQAAQGALLVSGVTNFGRYTDDQAQAIPRFRLGAGWQATDRLSFRAGYNVVVWESLVQAANHLPPNNAADPRNLEIPPAAGGGPEPAFPGIRGTTMVAQGLDLGLELWF
jgi:hypothetical protein